MHIAHKLSFLPLPLTVHIYAVHLQRRVSTGSPHVWPFSHRDIPFSGRHQGVPFSWMHQKGPFSWRCLVVPFFWSCSDDTSFSQESPDYYVSPTHQAGLLSWRRFAGRPQASSPPSSWRCPNASCSSALSFSCLRFQAGNLRFGTTVPLLLSPLWRPWGWTNDCEWVRIVHLWFDDRLWMIKMRYYFWVLGRGEGGGGGGYISSRGRDSTYRLGSRTPLLSFSKLSPVSLAMFFLSSLQGMIIFIGMTIPWKTSMKKKLMALWTQKMTKGERVEDLLIMGLINKPWSTKAKIVQ